MTTEIIYLVFKLISWYPAYNGPNAPQITLAHVKDWFIDDDLRAF